MFTVLSTLGLAHSLKSCSSLYLFIYLFMLIFIFVEVTKSGHVTKTILLILIPMLTEVEKNTFINMHNAVNNK
jgi:hypothetical protein